MPSPWRHGSVLFLLVFTASCVVPQTDFRCTSRAECAADQQCLDGACVPPCSGDADCPDGRACRAGACAASVGSSSGPVVTPSSAASSWMAGTSVPVSSGSTSASSASASHAGSSSSSSGTGASSTSAASSVASSAASISSSSAVSAATSQPASTATSAAASSSSALPTACVPDVITTRCDDGLACTREDTCMGGVCAGTNTCPAWLPACGAQGCTCPFNAACAIGASAGTCTAEGRCFVRVERPITSDDDDAEQEVDEDYENFSFMETDDVGDRLGWYFRNVDLVPGSTVAGAWMKVRVDTSNGDRFASDLLGVENAASPLPPTALNSPLLRRPVTGARTAWGGRLTGGANNTPDFSASLQELVDSGRVAPAMNVLVIQERQAAVQVGTANVLETDSLDICAHEHGDGCSAVLQLSVMGPAN